MVEPAKEILEVLLPWVAPFGLLVYILWKFLGAFIAELGTASARGVLALVSGLGTQALRLLRQLRQRATVTIAEVNEPEPAAMASPSELERNIPDPALMDLMAWTWNPARFRDPRHATRVLTDVQRVMLGITQHATPDLLQALRRYRNGVAHGVYDLPNVAD